MNFTINCFDPIKTGFHSIQTILQVIESGIDLIPQPIEDGVDLAPEPGEFTSNPGKTLGHT